MSLADVDASRVISDVEFQRFRDFFYRKTGISFENSKRYFVDKRLLERISATGAPSFRVYFTKMRFEASGEEFQNLVNAMTVNESYFCRESYQFDCLVDNVLGEVVERRKGPQPVRIWIMPSSTGEEAYTVAMYLLERWPLIAQVDVDIQASDIDTGVLARARQGLYSARSVQHVPSHWRLRHFSQQDGQFQISDDLRASINFSQTNLIDPKDSRAFRGFSVVFCRNMLIYFDEASRRQAIEAIYDALEPGGFVFLGHSESMSRISSLFQVRKFPQAVAYQKPLSARS